MVHFASEMERQGFDIPLLIGGATTSRAHTAVKVDQKYDGPVVWVKDASRSVPVAAALLSDEQRPKLLADVQADYDSLRDPARRQARPTAGHARAGPRQRDADRLVRLPAAATAPAAAAGARRVTRSSGTAASTQHVRVFHDYALERAAQVHRLAAVLQRLGDEGARSPTSSTTRRAARAARKLYDDAQAMLDQAIAEKWLTRERRDRALPGQRRSATTSRSTSTRQRDRGARRTLHNLRQQGEHREGVPNRSLADFVAPKETGLRDYVGAFAVTAGLGSAGEGRWSSRRTSTTTTRSCSSRSPTGSPRRSPSGCTSGSARSSGATRPTSTSTTRP